MSENVPITRKIIISYAGKRKRILNSYVHIRHYLVGVVVRVVSDLPGQVDRLQDEGVANNSVH